jgi:hypothetical protein
LVTNVSRFASRGHPGDPSLMMPAPGCARPWRLDPVPRRSFTRERPPAASGAARSTRRAMPRTSRSPRSRQPRAASSEPAAARSPRSEGARGRKGQGMRGPQPGNMPDRMPGRPRPGPTCCSEPRLDGSDAGRRRVVP